MDEQQPVTPQKEAERKSNKTVWIVLVVVAALLVCACVGVAIAGAALSSVRSRTTNGGRLAFEDLNLGVLRDLAPHLGGVVEAGRRFERTIADVQTPVTVRIDSEVGEVHVTAADVTEIEVTADLRAYGLSAAQAESNLDEIAITTERLSAGEVVIRASAPTGLFERRSPSVDIVVRVPRRSSLDVNLGVGKVYVADVTGDITVIADVGEIEITGVEGTVVARSDVGKVEVRDWVMTGDSEIRSDVGAIRVELRGDPAFELDASTNLGQIESDFVVAGGSRSTRGTGQTLVGTVGENPEMRLVLRSGTGAITLDEGQ